MTLFQKAQPGIQNTAVPVAAPASAPVEPVAAPTTQAPAVPATTAAAPPPPVAPPAPTQTAPTQQKQWPDFNALLAQYEAMCAGVFKQTTEIPDVGLAPELRECLIELARLIGYTDYNPETSKTLTFYVKGDQSRLIVPRMFAYGNTTCIKWTGDKVVVLDPSRSLIGDGLYMQTGKNAHVLVGTGTINYKCQLMIRSDYATESFLQNSLIQYNTAASMGQLLMRGEPKIAWSDVKDADVIRFYNIEQRTPEPEPGKQAKTYTDILGSVNDIPYTFWSAGEATQWPPIMAQLKAAAEGYLLVQKQGASFVVGGQTFTPKGRFVKLSDLDVGRTYPVLSYEIEPNGKFGLEVNLQVNVNGAEVSVRGNKTIENLLNVEPNPEVSEKYPATLHIIKKRESKDGSKTYVDCDLELASLANDPAMLFLKNLQAQNAAQSSDTPNVPPIGKPQATSAPAPL